MNRTFFNCCRYLWEKIFCATKCYNVIQAYGKFNVKISKLFFSSSFLKETHMKKHKTHKRMIPFAGALLDGFIWDLTTTFIHTTLHISRKQISIIKKLLKLLLVITWVESYIGKSCTIGVLYLFLWEQT